MDKKDSKSSLNDTSHLSASSAKSKKSTNNKVVVTLVVVVVVVAAVAAGLLVYKKVQDDKSASDKKTSSTGDSAKVLTPEEQLTKKVTDNVDQQIDAYKGGDDTQYLKQSTAAATSVGKDLDESQLLDQDK